MELEVLEDFFRISLGTGADMEYLVTALIK